LRHWITRSAAEFFNTDYGEDQIMLSEFYDDQRSSRFVILE
jgi:hypothetical protein